MIITKLIGGLGNQMFQFAAGRALAARRNVPLRLDIGDFRDYTLHQGFELNRVFKISAAIASPDDIRAVLGWRAHPRVLRILRRKRMSWLRTGRFAFEPQSHYWRGVSELPGECYMEGYWQSENYFKDVGATIRDEFTFAAALDPANQDCAARIAAGNSVSLHVRRGDYAANPKTLAIHGLISLDYYHRAVEFIAKRVGEPKFFVFSDDADWVKANLQLAYPCHYVESNTGANSYNDMRLMSLCRHHVIANSSFSWWGAWLDPRAGKIVIAPKRWFAQRDSSDLVPSDWVRL